MKYTIVLATLSAFVVAQTVDNLPACSVDCLNNGIVKAGCAATDTVCACSRADAINEYVTPCIEKECSPWDDYEFRYIVTEICYNAGVPIQELSSSPMMRPYMRHATHNPCKSSITHLMFVSLTLISIVLFGHTYWFTWTGDIPTDAPTASPTLNTLFTYHRSTFPDPPPSVTSCSVSTVMTAPSTVDTGSLPPYAAPSLVITSMSTSSSTISLRRSISTFPGAAPDGVRVGSVIIAGAVGLLGLVL
jgi:hypothetical protein